MNQRELDIYYLDLPDGGHSELDSHCEYCNGRYTKIKTRRVMIDKKPQILNVPFCGKCGKFRPDEITIKIEKTNKMFKRHVKLMFGFPTKEQIENMVDDEYVEWLQDRAGVK